MLRSFTGSSLLPSVSAVAVTPARVWSVTADATHTLRDRTCAPELRHLLAVCAPGYVAIIVRAWRPVLLAGLSDLDLLLVGNQMKVKCTAASIGSGHENVSDTHNRTYSGRISSVCICRPDVWGHGIAGPSWVYYYRPKSRSTQIPDGSGWATQHRLGKYWRTD